MKRAILGLLAAATGAACSDFVPVARELEPGVLAVDTAPGVSLEVLDWGGTGQPLVLLAGGGHTAHQYDEFAPLLADQFRVLGITRRGIGASSNSSPRSVDDHVSDVAAVLQALELESAVLVGHSFAGMEMVSFASDYPDECDALVYLDSAYDYTDPELGVVLQETPAPLPPAMTAADSASVEAVRAWSLRTQGFAIPESEVRATSDIDATGRVRGRLPSTATQVGPVPPEWGAIECAALGLYAVTAPLQTWLPHYSDRYEALSQAEREAADAYVEAFAAWTAKQREAFAQHPQNQAVEFPGSGHYFFLREPGPVVEVIQRFVLELQ